MLEMAMRSETDPLGIVQVPRDSLYGAQSERARGNFPTSGTALAALPELIICLAQVKEAAARANLAAGELEAEQAEAIVSACRQLIAGDHHEAFVVDVCQGGAGTSTNMNANEVIANLALRQLGFEPGRYEVISPNDHVNRSQSTNDAYSTAVRLTVHRLNLSLVAALDRLSAAMRGKAEAFAAIPKLGRTQLQDAVPMTLGEEFGAYAATIAEDAARANEMGALFLEVNLGGTAIGTGLGSSQAYRDAVGPALAEVTGWPIVIAPNLVEATWDMGAFVLYSGMLKRTAAKLSKISNDLRLLSSGPHGGLAEISLPPRQPGSSLMPGKVNPVIPEAINCIAFRVFGHDTTITFAAEGGQLQLNAFEPVIIWSIYEASTLLCRGIDMLIAQCIDGIEANPAICLHHLQGSTALATALVPRIGYRRAAAIAQRAQAVGLAGAVAELEPEHSDFLDEISHDAVRKAGL